MFKAEKKSHLDPNHAHLTTTTTSALLDEAGCEVAAGSFLHHCSLCMAPRAVHAYTKCPAAALLFRAAKLLWVSTKSSRCTNANHGPIDLMSV